MLVLGLGAVSQKACMKEFKVLAEDALCLTALELLVCEEYNVDFRDSLEAHELAI